MGKMAQLVDKVFFVVGIGIGVLAPLTRLFAAGCHDHEKVHVGVAAALFVLFSVFLIYHVVMSARKYRHTFAEAPLHLSDILDEAGDIMDICSALKASAAAILRAAGGLPKADTAPTTPSQGPQQVDADASEVHIHVTDEVGATTLQSGTTRQALRSCSLRASGAPQQLRRSGSSSSGLATGPDQDHMSPQPGSNVTTCPSTPEGCTTTLDKREQRLGTLYSEHSAQSRLSTPMEPTTVGTYSRGGLKTIHSDLFLDVAVQDDPKEDEEEELSGKNEVFCQCER